MPRPRRGDPRLRASRNPRASNSRGPCDLLHRASLETRGPRQSRALHSRDLLHRASLETRGPRQSRALHSRWPLSREEPKKKPSFVMRVPLATRLVCHRSFAVLVMSCMHVLCIGLVALYHALDLKLSLFSNRRAPGNSTRPPYCISLTCEHICIMHWTCGNCF